MADPVSDVFSHIRSVLQQHDLTWQRFLDAIHTTYGQLDDTQHAEFRERYATYIEEALDARFEDWQRTISLDHYLARANPLAVDLARHLEVRYRRDVCVKRYFERCARHFATHPLNQFTALSIEDLGERNALHLVKLLAAHRPDQLTTFGFSRERFLRVTARSRHREVFDALLSLPDPDTLTTLAIKWNLALRKESERDLHDALRAHLPRYTALTTFTLAEEFEVASHITDLHEVIPHTVTHLSLNTTHVSNLSSLLASPLIARQHTLRLGGVSREMAHAILDDHLLLHLSHMDLAWDYRQHPWLDMAHASPRTIQAHDLSRAAHDDVHIPRAQLHAKALSLGQQEPLTFTTLRAMLCQADGSPREFPFLETLDLHALDRGSLELLWTCGAPCFPKLTQLSVHIDVPDATPVEIAWHEAPVWHGVTCLKIFAKQLEMGRSLDPLWANMPSRCLFPDVTEFTLGHVDLDTYARAIPVLLTCFPELRTLGTFTAGFRGETLTQSVFELLREHDLFRALHALDFYLYERVGLYTSTDRIAYWASLLDDEAIPVHLRRYIFHQLVAYPSKGDLLDHIAPAMGVALPKSASKAKLIERLAATLPEALQSYDTFAEFEQRPHTHPIVLHTP